MIAGKKCCHSNEVGIDMEKASGSSQLFHIVIFSFLRYSRPLQLDLRLCTESEFTLAMPFGIVAHS